MRFYLTLKDASLNKIFSANMENPKIHSYVEWLSLARGLVEVLGSNPDWYSK
jgi:hypothetical protein